MSFASTQGIVVNRFSNIEKAIVVNPMCHLKLYKLIKIPRRVPDAAK